MSFSCAADPIPEQEMRTMWNFQHHQDSRIRRPHTRRAPAPRRHGFRPRLEGLEGRTLLSNYTAASVADLIADIKLSNQAGGSNTITLVAGNPFQLTAVDNTTDGATGLPVIAANDSLTVVGNGDTIARGTAAGTPAFRLFDVAARASLTLQKLTLQGGLASGAGVSADGGAIYNQGKVDLNSVTIQSNIAQGSNGNPNQAGQSAAGGGIYSAGTLTLEGGAQVQNNQAVGGQGGRGNIGRSGVNGGNGLGGGLFVAGGTLTLTSATLSANSAQGGQGGNGGGSGSAILDGLNATSGGNGGTGSGGGLYVAGGTVTLTNAILSANTAQGGQGGRGGGHLGHGGSGGSGLGGGLYAGGGTVTMHDDTVSGNAAQGGPGGTRSGSSGVGEGGGLFIDPAAVVYLDAFTQAHVTNNTASTKDPNIHGPWKPS